MCFEQVFRRSFPLIFTLIGDIDQFLKLWYEFNICMWFSPPLLDLIDPVTLETPLSKNLVAQISALALQLDSEDLYSYSGSQLFEMHEKLGTMANSIIRNLQSRWRSTAQENS